MSFVVKNRFSIEFFSINFDIRILLSCNLENLI